jgi:hypothetical protein
VQRPSSSHSAELGDYTTAASAVPQHGHPGTQCRCSSNNPTIRRQSAARDPAARNQMRMSRSRRLRSSSERHAGRAFQNGASVAETRHAKRQIAAIGTLRDSLASEFARWIARAGHHSAKSPTRERTAGRPSIEEIASNTRRIGSAGATSRSINPDRRAATQRHSTNWSASKCHAAATRPKSPAAPLNT